MAPLLSAQSLWTLGTIGCFGGGGTIDEAATMKHSKTAQRAGAEADAMEHSKPPNDATEEFEQLAARSE